MRKYRGKQFYITDHLPPNKSIPFKNVKSEIFFCRFELD